MFQVKRIRFQGQEYWLVASALCEGLISPIEHYNEKGIPQCGWHDVSYAIIEFGNVLRYGKIIGSATEIEYL